MIDNNLSPALVAALAELGIASIHVRSLGLEAASDRVVMEAARQDGRVLVSRDGDFAAMLAATNAPVPSLVHLRVAGLNQPADQAALLLRVLRMAGQELASGAIVSVRGERIRIRALPLEQE